jgi:hypothetical protein
VALAADAGRRACLGSLSAAGDRHLLLASGSLVAGLAMTSVKRQFERAITDLLRELEAVGPMTLTLLIEGLERTLRLHARRGDPHAGGVRNDGEGIA